MTLRSLAAPSALVFLMSSTALWADVTPEQVWQGWQDASTAMGNTVKADSAARDGDTLVVTNIALTDRSGGKLAIETISFTDNGDGTVAVEMPDTYPLKLTIPATVSDPTSKATDLLIDVSMPGATVTASGMPGAINYKTDAPTLGLVLNAVDGASAEAMKVTAEAKLTGLVLNYVATMGAIQTYAEDFSVKSFEISAKGAGGTTGSDFDLKASVADLTTKVALAVPKDSGTQDTSEQLTKGLTVNANLTFGATKLDLNANDAGTPALISTSLASGIMGLIVDATRLDYTTTTKGMSLKIASPDIPVPDATLNWGEAGFHILMPVAKSDVPADFSFLVNLADVGFSDDLWGLIDPAKALKHDPATIVLDTTGKATMQRDLITDAADASMGDTSPPAVLTALNVNNLRVKAAGAEVTAHGAFTFDNSDMTTYRGLPAPTGKIDIKASGVNALIDTLVKMGLVPQEQAMSGRMMLSMFANTSATADEMTSTLEFKDKHFFANGQQLQ